jgi:hypothetical protein
MAHRVAIVLRGPPCGGKTTVLRFLRARLPTSASVSLDDGWSKGERRFGADRYGDLRAKGDPLLVELGFGEPEGLSFPGATRNPREWVDILMAEGRAVFLFLLKPPLAELDRRIQADRSPHQRGYFRGAARLYESHGVCAPSVFGMRLGNTFRETHIDTSLESPAETADRILRRAQALA